MLLRRYYSDFIGPADAAVRAEVEVDEELDAEEQEKLKGTKDEMKLVFDRIDENGNGFVRKAFAFIRRLPRAVHSLCKMGCSDTWTRRSCASSLE